MQHQISSPKTPAQYFLRTNASKTNGDERGGVSSRAARDGRDFYAEIESGRLELDERLEEMGIEPQEYRTYETPT
jgi:hypothetical protein